MNNEIVIYNVIRVTMGSVNVFIFGYYICLFIIGIHHMAEAHQVLASEEYIKLRVQCVGTLVYALCMLSFGIMYFAGLSLDVLVYLLLAFSFIVSVVSELSGGIILSGNEIRKLSESLSSNH